MVRLDEAAAPLTLSVRKLKIAGFTPRALKLTGSGRLRAWRPERARGGNVRRLAQLSWRRPDIAWEIQHSARFGRLRFDGRRDPHDVLPSRRYGLGPTEDARRRPGRERAE